MTVADSIKAQTGKAQTGNAQAGKADAGRAATDRNLRFSDAAPLGARRRIATFAVVAVLHIAAVIGILQGFGGIAGLPRADRGGNTTAYDVPLDPPTPSPTASLTTESREAEGAEGKAGRKAEATQIVAAPARIPTRSVRAAPAASTGNDTRSGASAAGDGTGAAAAGAGTGSGGAGNGGGGRHAPTRPVKIAGEITSARDYPRQGRETRLGRSVVILLTVGTDGVVTGCKVHRPSGDAEADAVTCRLARERFRFRPAFDQNGIAVESTYGWEQRWFAP